MEKEVLVDLNERLLQFKDGTYDVEVDESKRCIVIKKTVKSCVTEYTLYMDDIDPRVLELLIYLCGLVHYGAEMDEKQLARMFNVSIHAIRHYRKVEGMPFVKYVKNMRYRFGEVLEWLKGRVVNDKYNRIARSFKPLSKKENKELLSQ
jgi:hypothetical protein